MRLLLDDNLGFSVLAALTERGHDVVPVAGPDDRAANDEEVLAEARAAHRILVTMDEGFAGVDPAGSPGIVVISLPDSGAEPPTRDDLDRRAVEAGRAALDLVTERHLLDDQLVRLDEELARLAGAAEDAMRDGREDDARELFEEKASTSRRIEEMRRRRDDVRDQERSTHQKAERVRATVDRLRFEETMAAADELLAAVGVRAEERRVGHTAGAGEDEPRRAILARLSPVWGSLAGELAAAIAGLVAALDEADPAGQVWIAGVDGVRDTGAEDGTD